MTELKKEFKTLDSYADELAGYGTGTHISDAIREIADGATSIYYSDILNFIRKNPEDVNEAVAEFGWDGCGGDIMKAAQMGEYLKIERETYDELEDGIYNYCIDYIIDVLDIDLLPDDVFTEIEEIISEEWAQANTFFDVTCEIDKILEGHGFIDDDGKYTQTFLETIGG